MKRLSLCLLLLCAFSASAPAAPMSLDEGQFYVMDHVAMGDPWEPQFWVEKLGPFEVIPYEGSHNAALVKCFYFPGVDMTFIVNTYKNTIITWREGREGK
ncbi:MULTISPECIES: hypothetical protein [unclassified Pyramidobacter]|uniref:hypothetical protein n=1 Tax=unclassified Pyramidobacter TaxID=2632171 RepID=UPI000EA24EFC|nr:hypothetical protein [Pyramidobacter sp. CG50-2]RKJ80539.1 hypothetical protein D7D26_02915 [Pyramidobacter sp. CG50-2]